MFDAKSLLNMALGAGRQAGAQGGSGQGLAGQGLAGQGLAGIVGGVLSGLQDRMGQAGQPGQAAQGPGGSAGGFAGMLGGALSGRGDAPTGQQAPAQGLMPADVAKALAQAQEAVRTGNYAALTEQARGFLQGNAGGLLVGGLAGLALGTGAGRSLLGSAAKLGGLALIGGLAYKAYQTHRQGRPAAAAAAGELLPAPQGSGFAEGDGDDNERALRLVRAMVAAAAADGHIDDAERARIASNLAQAGLSDEAAGFLERELAHPMDATALAALAATPEQAAQIYTAARLAIEPDSTLERTFLADLAAGLSLDAELVAHIDAAAASVMAQAA